MPDPVLHREEDQQHKVHQKDWPEHRQVEGLKEGAKDGKPYCQKNDLISNLLSSNLLAKHIIWTLQFSLCKLYALIPTHARSTTGHPCVSPVHVVY